jgi:hypothetical protein
MKMLRVLLGALLVPIVLLGQVTRHDFKRNKVKHATTALWTVNSEDKKAQRSPDYRAEREYDLEGNLLYLVTYNGAIKGDSITYKYDSNNRIIELTLYQNKRGFTPDYLAERQIKKFDEMNNEVYYSVETNGRKSVEEYSYKYENGKLIQKTVKATNSKGSYEDIIEYQYDKKGNLVLQTSSYMPSTQVKYLITYAKKSDKISSILNLSKAREEFYDEQNNIFHVVEAGIETYFKYDSNKNVIEKVVENNQGSIINGPKHLFMTYDKYGHLTGRTEKTNKEPTEKWTYNDNGLLLEYMKGNNIEKYNYVFY